MSNAELVTPAGDVFRVEATVTPISQGPMRFSLWLVGASFALLGAAVLLRRPDLSTAKVFAAFAGTTALALVVAPSAGGPAPEWAFGRPSSLFNRRRGRIRGLDGGAHGGFRARAALPVFASSRGTGSGYRRCLWSIGRGGAQALRSRAPCSDSVRVGMRDRLNLAAGRPERSGASPPDPAAGPHCALGHCVECPPICATNAHTRGTGTRHARACPSQFPGPRADAGVFRIRHPATSVDGDPQARHRGMVYGLATLGLFSLIGHRAGRRGSAHRHGWRRYIFVPGACSILDRGNSAVLSHAAATRWVVDRLVYGEVVDPETFLGTLEENLVGSMSTVAVATGITGRFAQALRLESALMFLGPDPHNSQLVAAMGDRARSVVNDKLPHPAATYRGGPARPYRIAMGVRLLSPYYAPGLRPVPGSHSPRPEARGRK